MTSVEIKNKEGVVVRDVLEEEYKRCFNGNREELRHERKHLILKI